MEDSMPPGDNDPQDVTMTKTDDGFANIFDDMLAEMEEQWGSQVPFVLENEVPSEHCIDPAILAQSQDVPDLYIGLTTASASPTRHEDQAYPSAITSSPIFPSGPVAVSTPIRDQKTSTTASSEYSPTSVGLHTPTRRDRGHYGSARRRTGALSNFQSIAASPEREAVQANTGYTFSPIPEYQQGILSPGNFINEDIPEFRPRRVLFETSDNHNGRFEFPGEPSSPCLAADPDMFEGTAGDFGFGSQGTESGATQDMAQVQQVLQLSDQFAVAPQDFTDGIAISHSPSNDALVDLSTSANGNVSAPSYSQQFEINTSVALRNTNVTVADTLPNHISGGPPITMAANITIPAVSNGNIASNIAVPWTSGLNFAAEPDPERRAKMRQIASVSHMLLTSKDTEFAARKARVLQAGAAADLEMKNKKPAKRAKKNTTAQRNTNAKNNGNLAPPSSTSQVVSPDPAFTRPSVTVRARKVSMSSIPTNEERIAQFWNGRLDKYGNEIEAAFLCHGSLEKYQSGPATENTAAEKSEFGQYAREPANDHPKLAEDTPAHEAPHSELMLYSDMMNERNFERAVFPGQVILTSYDIKSDWWQKVNIFAWNRFGTAYCLDEIAIMITPFHIMFARIPNIGDTAMMRKDWQLIMGLIEKTYKTPVVGAEQRTWAYMYRLIPCPVKEQEDIGKSRDHMSTSLELFNRLEASTVYRHRFRQFAYYVPRVGDSGANCEFAIRVGRFGQKGEYDRPRVEIRDLAGKRIIRD